MTKPISYHLTTGTFNYVVKDPNCIHLSGQLWIKDEIGISQICVLELDALLSSVVTAYLHLSIDFFEPYFGPSRITSAASDVLANFSRLSIFISYVNFFSIFFHFSVNFSAQQKTQKKLQRNDVRTAQNVKTS
jgi:hypothetical protein